MSSPRSAPARAALALVTACALGTAWAGQPEGAAVRIPAGRFAPLFGLDRGQRDLPLAAFWIDRALVTNEDFRSFVERHDEWRPGGAPSLFADAQYLAHWTERARPPDALARAPVTHVSWFAARAFCESRGGRLPTVLEWEYVAAADETRADASRTPEFSRRILEWYARPASADDLLRRKALSAPNLYGVRELHAVVWEWTEDFNATFVTGDNRQDGDKSVQMFCGSGATGAANREDYAAFMRYALRSSVKATYTMGTLGFRCAYDQEPRGAAR